MPFKPNERMYRSFTAASLQQARDENDEPEEYTVRGYFTTFDEPYQLWEDLIEVIDPHAFDQCDTSDVIFQSDHDGPPLARTRNGSLVVGFDEHGGWCTANLGGSQAGRERFEAIRSGLIDQMSFGFIIADDGFDYDDETHTSRITNVRKIFDISSVTWPANPGTEIHARSYLDGAIEASRQKQQELLRRAEQRKRTAAALELIKLI